VLAVDDNHTKRQILRNQVGVLKMQVGSGDEALDQLRAAGGEGQPYDVALLDVQMPEMDGFALAAAIKSDSLLTGTRLFVLTSVGHVLNSAELKQLGMVAAAMLEKRDHTPVKAANSHEAAEAARRGGFDLIFMDVKMPEMDGFEAKLCLRPVQCFRDTSDFVLAV
jgi:CheY-like chemotaxis protein